MAQGTGGSLVDDFEDAFQGTLNILSRDETVNPRLDKEELKHHAEQSVLQFIDCAKKLEIFFFQKRFQLSLMKPEQILKEDINEMKQEIERKDHLIRKHYEKVGRWQAQLSDAPPAQPIPTQSQQPVVPQQSPLAQQVPPRPPMPIQTTMSQMNMSQGMQSGVNSQFGPGMGQPVPVAINPGPAPSQMQPGYPNMGGMARMAHPGMQGANTGLQGPLAYLEKTTSNIGMGR